MTMKSLTRLMALVSLVVVANATLQTQSVVTRRLADLVSHKRLAKSPEPTRAGAYLEKLLADYSRARQTLVANYTKRSKAAVIYMCYERSEIIVQSLDALFKSEGLENFDVFISQDGGTGYEVDVSKAPPHCNLHYIRHAENLCTGLHHYFVKAFAFDIMSYEALIVIEEDNVIHPQALQMLSAVLEQSVSDRQIGLVAITDMENSLLVDEQHFAAGYQRAEIDQGHLWVYAVHTTRYQAVWQYLRDYYDIIKRYDYRRKDQPPLAGELIALMESNAFPTGLPLSQDSYFVNSLAKAGFIRRFTTMVRLFEPVGWEGLHFRRDQGSFYGVYGRGMFEGRVNGTPFEVTMKPSDILKLERDCKERLNVMYQHYLGRGADQRAVNAAVTRLLTAKLNAIELARNLFNTKEHRRRMKSIMVQGAPGRAKQLA